VRRYRTVLLASALLALSACSGSRSIVVLLPDTNGTTGQVTVTNAAGSQLLREPLHFTEVVAADTIPRPPEVMAANAFQETFGETLAALPARPLHFILYFKTDTTELTDESRKVLAQVMPAVAERASTDVSIVGHTDRVGDRRYNYQLGLERALLLRTIILSLGINPEHIEATSHGENNPLLPTADAVPEARNRRVEVVVR
jgi:outer membrane protein OmpA-like peptidoglycan-associated protein